MTQTNAKAIAQLATMHAGYHYLNNFILANKNGEIAWSTHMHNAIDNQTQFGEIISPEQFQSQFAHSTWTNSISEVPGYFLTLVVENHTIEAYMTDWMKEDEQAEIHLITCKNQAMLVLFNKQVTDAELFEYFTNMTANLVPSRDKKLTPLQELAHVCLTKAITIASPQQLEQIENVTHALEPSNPFIKHNKDHFEAALAGVTIQTLAMIMHKNNYKDMAELRRAGREALSGDDMEYRITPLIIEDEKTFDIFATLNEIASPLGFEVQSRKLDHADYTLMTISAPVANLVDHTDTKDDHIINDYLTKLQ